MTTDSAGTHIHLVSGNATLAGDAGAVNALVLQGAAPAHATLDGAWSLHENADGSIAIDGARAGAGLVAASGMQFIGTGANAYRLYVLASAGHVTHTILTPGTSSTTTLFNLADAPATFLTDPATGPSVPLLLEAGGGNTVTVALSAGDPTVAAYYVTGADDVVVLRSGSVALVLPGAASAFAVRSQPGGDTLVSGGGIGTLRIRYQGGAGELVFHDATLALAQTPAVVAPTPSAPPATTPPASAAELAAQEAQQAAARAAPHYTALAERVAGPVARFPNAAADYQVVANADGSFVLRDAAGSAQPGAGATLAFSDGLGLADPDGGMGAVARLYQACLNRAPDFGGLIYWATQAAAGLPIGRIAAEFAGSPEFAANYGELDNAGYVARLYRNVLHRDGEASGIAYWGSALAGGAARGMVLNAFAQSVENVDGTIGRYDDPGYAEAYRLYRAGFARAPDQAGLDYWTGAMHGGLTAGEMAHAFAGSAEFQANYGGLGDESYVRQLYANVLGREGERTGVSYWTGQLNAGADRASVLQSFADGSENLAHTASATHAGWVFVAG